MIRAIAYSVILTSLLAFVAIFAYGLGQGSVRNASFVKFYPRPFYPLGPYTGECFFNDTGAFCIQEKRR